MDKKILIIEDNDIDLLLAKRHLAELGYTQIESAEYAEDGIKKAIEQKPDLVISDTILPDGNGFDVCQRIKDGLGVDGVQVIITTGAVDAVDATRARRAGADDYCAKASDCAPLIEAVKRLFKL